MTSQILGNLIAAFTLGYFPQVIYFLLMGLLALLASISFMFLRPPDKKEEILVSHSLEPTGPKTTFK